MPCASPGRIREAGVDATPARLVEDSNLEPVS